MYGREVVTANAYPLPPLTKARTTDLRHQGPGAGGLSLLGMYLGGITNGFHFGDLPEMKNDPDVSLGLEYLLTPILNAVVTVKGAGEEVDFAQKTFDAFWHGDLESFKDMFCYGWCPAEVLYKKQDDKLVYDRMLPQYPDKCIPYVEGGKLTHIRVHDQVNLEGAAEVRPAKGFWLANDPTYSPWQGNSVMPRAWLFWRVKVGMPDSAVEVLLKANYKAAFSGLMIRYPASEAIADADGVIYDPRAEAEWYAENSKAGSNFVLPSNVDPVTGKPEWDIASYGGQPVDIEKMLPLQDWLSKQIHRGMGVPDEVIAHEGNTGGYSRSNVALQMFLMLALRRARRIARCFADDVVKPLCRRNGGKGDFELDVKIPGMEDAPNDPNNPNGAAPEEGSLSSLFHQGLTQGPEAAGANAQPPQEKPAQPVAMSMNGFLGEVRRQFPLRNGVHG